MMIKCKKCQGELLHYTQGRGAWNVPGYPYESGYYCPKCKLSWSDLQIARGELDEVKDYLLTPKKWNTLSDEDKSNTLTLHFIGFTAKPTGINEILYQKCLEAFSNNRGKYERECEAILKVIEGNNGKEPNPESYYDQYKKDGKIYCKIGKKHCKYCRPIFFHLHCDYVEKYLDILIKCEKENKKHGKK